MKRKVKLGKVIIVLYIALIPLMTFLDVGMERYIEISAAFIILTFIVLFETGEMDARTMAALATLSALGGVLRVPFAAIPGFQPVTFICAVTGFTLGPVNGFMVGAMCAFISNLFLGQGPWTLWQMMGWGLCGVCFGILRKPIKKTGIKGFVIFCGLWGYIYGTILNQWYILEYLGPSGISFDKIIAGNVLSFWHDTMHSLGNVVFSSIFGKSFIEALERYNKRNKVIRIRTKTED